jgi:hypothetical protein
MGGRGSRGRNLAGPVDHLHGHGRGFSFNAPKTAKSRRNVRLAIRAVDALRKHCKAQLEERMRLAGLFSDHGLVFRPVSASPYPAKTSLPAASSLS